MNFKSHQQRYHRCLSILLCVLLIQAEVESFAETISQQTKLLFEYGPPYSLSFEQNKTLEVFKPFTPAKSFDEAKLTIQAAEKRKMSNFNSPRDLSEFDLLIQANVITKFIVEKDLIEFQQWWRENRTSLMSEIPKMGKDVSWQIFLANIYIKFKLLKSKALIDPTEFIQWMKSVINTPWVQHASMATFAMLTGIFSFVTGVVYGAMVSGPAAGFISAFLEPLIRPLREKGVIVGIQLFGKTGKAINSVMFDGKATENLVVEMKDTKKSISDVRSLITTDIYTLTPQQWIDNLQKLYHSWNHLNYVWNKMPDVYKGGRDRMTDQLIFRPRDFSNSVTQAISAAEIHRQGAEQMLDRIILKSTAPNDVLRISEELYKIIEKQMQLERSPEGQSTELNLQIEGLKQQLVDLGSSPPQAERVIENYKRIFIFTRQAATVLAGQLLHDTEFSDTIVQARGAFEAMRAGNCLQFFHKELAAEVKDILDRISFEIDLNIKALDGETKNADKAKDSSQTFDIISKINGSKEGLRVANEPGSLTKPTKENEGSRVKEAVRAAERK
jgi:hypothetical protein